MAAPAVRADEKDRGKVRVKDLLITALLLAALYGAWLGLDQTGILSGDIRFQGHSEYGALLNGRR